MKIILLSGGSGQRLWPLSNNIRSKQFLKVLENNDGISQSMVQRVWEQLVEVGLANSTVIATSKTQAEMIHNQIGEDVPLIIEPERRDTFPAIALACSYLYSLEETDINETVVVLPVDPFVEDDFFYNLLNIESLLNKSNAELALIGVEPTYPSSKYGYIVPDLAFNNTDEYYLVDRFTEKPDEQKAEQLIKQRALWNCGVFAFKLKYLLDVLETRNLPTDYIELNQIYNKLPKISFDYAVVEKAHNIIVKSYNGYWKDLGTWNTLTEEMAKNQIGKGKMCHNSESSHLVNELEIPIVVLGLSNIIVAASPDGILVADKKHSPKIKEHIAEFNQQPMYEERIWGWSKILDYAKYEHQEMVTKRICINQGKNSTLHHHNLRNEIWTITRGEGELFLNNNIQRVKAGDVIHIPNGKLHAIKALSELEFIEVQTGREVANTDIIRLYKEWDDILDYYNKSRSQLII